MDKDEEDGEIEARDNFKVRRIFALSTFVGVANQASSGLQRPSLVVVRRSLPALCFVLPAGLVGSFVLSLPKLPKQPNSQLLLNSPSSNSKRILKFLLPFSSSSHSHHSPFLRLQQRPSSWVVRYTPLERSEMSTPES
jgi:hypothetical protein